MSYSNSLLFQLTVVLTSLGFGFLVGIIYETVFVVRSFFSHGKKATVVGDIVFCVIGTVLTFLYMLVFCGGRFRYNYLLGEIAGIILFHFSFGKVIESSSEKIFHLLRKVLGTIFSPFVKLYKYLSSKVITVLKKLIGKIKKKSEFLRKKS